MPKTSHTSISEVSRTGRPAPSWTLDEELTGLANKCYIACLSPYAKPDLIRVYRNGSETVLGRCWFDHRIITIARACRRPYHTLAHEIAHLKVRTHCPAHERVTEELYAWIENYLQEQKV
jgi:hypothetical protein